MDELQQEASIKRKQNFLHILLSGLLVIHILALGVMLIPPISLNEDFILLGACLLMGLVIFFVNKHGYIQLASYLLCIGFNFILFLAFLSNVALLPNDGQIPVSLMGFMLSLVILLSGMLIGQKAPFWFAAINITFVFISLTTLLNNIEDAKLFIRIGVPVTAFLILITLISWLYQRTLNQALDNLFEARREAARVELLERDLQIAHDVQQQFYPPPPNYDGRVRFAARSKPAQETGGDFYDFIPLDDDHVAIVVGDVSGKSIPAAIHMAVVRGIMRHGARADVPAAEVLAQVNATTYQDASIDRMITCFYGLLNLNTMKLSFANAGHPYVLLKRDGTLESFEAPGFPLNAVPNPEYLTYTRQLQQGDQLLWISDGIVEAFNPQRELFSFDRLETTFTETNGHAPDAILEHIWHTVRTFQNGEPQTDDITLVVASIDCQPTT